MLEKKKMNLAEMTQIEETFVLSFFVSPSALLSARFSSLLKSNPREQRQKLSQTQLRRRETQRTTTNRTIFSFFFGELDLSLRPPPAINFLFFLSTPTFRQQ